MIISTHPSTHNQPPPPDTRLLDAIRARRSIRRYSRQPVSQAVIEALLMAASWSPSAHNRQPWRFVAVTTALVQEKLARQMGERLRADLRTDGVSVEAIEQDAARSYSRITGAAALIVVCMSLVDMDHYPDAHRAQAEYLMAAQSTAMAAQNLLLAAHSYGLGACWMCAPLFCPEVVQEALALPADWQPQALITLGYPAETKIKSREPLETRVLWR